MKIVFSAKSMKNRVKVGLNMNPVRSFGPSHAIKACEGRGTDGV